MANPIIKVGTKIVNKANPDWGVWRITKVPTPREDWYEKSGASGCNVLFEEELRFWDIVD
jgi:hypothetical protein